MSGSSIERPGITESTNRLSGFFGLLALLAFVGLSPATAQVDSVRVWQQLEASHSKLGIESYTPIVYHIARARDNGHQTHRHLFMAGTEYVITAACDEECKDLDVTITALEDERALVEDTDDDAVTSVSFTPTESGAYNVEIHVGTCSEPFCHYGYSLLRKPGSPEE